MLRFISILHLRQYLFLLFLTLLFIFPLLLFVHHQHSFHPSSRIELNIRNMTRYEQFCWQLDLKIAHERASDAPVHLNSREQPIPYAYSRWRSTSLLPRLLTPCEHAIYMHLLAVLVENVFQKYGIPYMMMAATLLGKCPTDDLQANVEILSGSYTRHDILPWDDDVDLRVSISDRVQLQSIIRRELSVEPYSIVLMQMHNERNYDKVFFTWSPHAGAESWRFPFIDIFYHDQNATHVWLLGQPASCPVRREDVFPLVLRPLGPLWLSAPREPMAHFESRNMRQIETGCYMFPYSHKHERLLRDDALYAECEKLKPFYPYVERECTTNRCVESLKIAETTVIHTLNYQNTYRTFLYAETNTSYRAC